MTDGLLLAASIVFFMAGLLLARRSAPATAGTICLLVLAAVFFLLHDLYMVSWLFTGNWFDESVLFHLSYGVGGAGFGEYWPLIAGSLAFVTLGITATYFVISGGRVDARPSPAKWSTLLAYLLVVTGTGLIPGNLQLADALLTRQQSGFHTYYRTPHIDRAPDSKRNLVFLYLEGLERTYFDENLFPGLIRELRKLETQSTSFTNLRQTWGTGWTIGGMTATQCGIPLVTPSHGNSMRGMDDFLEGAVCLGDLLASDGYRLSYLGGSSLEFAGKGKFYASHGFSDIRGRNALTHLLTDREYLGPWGLHDDSLFDIAYQRYLDLSADGKPFGLFMLTLDTHPPRGNLSSRCSKLKYGDGSNPVLNAVACSDFLAGEFINRIIRSEYADNTIIVVASDHLSLKNTAYGLLKDADRTNLFMVIEPGSGHAAKINRMGSMLDVGAIMLHVLGYEGTLGLGRDLLGGETSLMASLDNINAGLQGWKETLIEFWDFPRLESDVSVDALFREMVINKRTFQVPALVTFNRAMDTKIRFQFDRSPEHKRLADHVSRLDMDTPFLWLDDCKVIKIVAARHGLCGVLGKMGSRKLKGFRINGSLTIPLEDLRSAGKQESGKEGFAWNRQRMGFPVNP